MMESVFGRCGVDSGAAGCPDFWWDGRYYGCVMPEELIDAELLAASENMEEIEDGKEI